MRLGGPGASLKAPTWIGTLPREGIETNLPPINKRLHVDGGMKYSQGLLMGGGNVLFRQRSLRCLHLFNSGFVCRDCLYVVVGQKNPEKNCLQVDVVHISGMLTDGRGGSHQYPRRGGGSVLRKALIPSLLFVVDRAATEAASEHW